MLISKFFYHILLRKQLKERFTFDLQTWQGLARRGDTERLIGCKKNKGLGIGARNIKHMKYEAALAYEAI